MRLNAPDILAVGGVSSRCGSALYSGGICSRIVAAVAVVLLTTYSFVVKVEVGLFWLALLNALCRGEDSL